MVDEADALLVAGSSLTVFSGLRFVRHAAALGVPVAIINRGRTRGDDLATVKIDTGCSPMLALLADELPDRHERMNPPNPFALLNRVRSKSCPAEERWSLSIGDLIADAVNAPGRCAQSWAAQPLRRRGDQRRSPSSSTATTWSGPTLPTSAPAISSATCSPMRSTNRSASFRCRGFPDAGCCSTPSGAAVLTALVAVAGKQLETVRWTSAYPPRCTTAGCCEVRSCRPACWLRWC